MRWRPGLSIPPLFATLGPASPQKSGLQYWLDTHREPVFLSTASLVEIEAAIERVPASQQARICALRDWLDGLISSFSDRIHLVDAEVAVRAGTRTHRTVPSPSRGLTSNGSMSPRATWH
jgi:hypothetical protein